MGDKFKGIIENKGKAFNDCGQNVYSLKNSDKAKLEALYNSDEATNAWYAGQKEYDYSKGMPYNKVLPIM